MSPPPGSFVLSILVPKLTVLTVCPKITSTNSTSKLQLNAFQYSVGDAVMLDAISYGQDCIWLVKSTRKRQYEMAEKIKISILG